MNKTLGVLACLLLSAMVNGTRADALWTDDFAEASRIAKAENRFMLLNFTGSDWCGWCIKLDKEVFSKSEFKQFAKEKLVAVTVDFPAQKKISSKIAKQNEQLKSTFSIRGYPTIIVLNPLGEKVAQTGYKEGGAEVYVQHLRALIEPHAAKFGPVIAAAATTPGTAAADPRGQRTWTSSTGNTIDARYDQRIGNQISLRKADGSLVRIDLSSLSETDRDYLRSIKAIQ
jgi:thioredoxin-related protein